MNQQTKDFLGSPKGTPASMIYKDQELDWWKAGLVDSPPDKSLKS